jgi:hypothetical protein
MPGQERYYCQNNKWTASLPIYYSTQKEFIGYVIKKMESCLRKTVKYKYALNAEAKTGYRAFQELKELEAAPSDFDNVIENAVADFHRDITRTIVTVDHANLARIRKEAIGTQEKLIVPEEGADSESVNSGSELRSPSSELSEQLQDGWVALKESLNQTEIKALAIALADGAGVKAFADENGIMLEVLADSINEKAADYIGDSILEVDDGIIIYDEYRENIAEMVGWVW